MTDTTDNTNENKITAPEVSKIAVEIIKRDIQEGVELDIEAFINLLMYSLSLTVSEKKRVIDSTPKLSQFQFDSLIGVFEEERVKFKELMAKHPEEVKKLVVKQQEGWLELGEVYQQEAEEKEVTGEEEQKIDDIKASLGL
ncbi:MAG: hypothetical protein N4A38_00170 [Candidatus Gracilibacteria bacterium]|nr:hypothetical protein [Candidatus Gracilibacteria bacterium]